MNHSNFIIKTTFTLALILLSSLIGYAQTYNLEKEPREEAYFTVRGTVRDKYSFKPIEKVNIQVNGGAYAVTSFDGQFNIKVKVGDELVIRHKDFQTVYHTVTSNDRLIIEVDPDTAETIPSQLKKKRLQSFNQLIDSADTYLKKDVERSSSFITDALNQSASQQQNAEAYETLGDLYMYWKQYDLAVSNYRIALQNVSSQYTKLKLAQAYAINKNYQESIQTFLSIETPKLTNYQQTEYYEGLGDVYLKTDDVIKAIAIYQRGLTLAQTYKIKPKITDLNSKMAQAFNANGEIGKAQDLFKTSLVSAEQENKKRAVEEKVTVAEFNNDTQNYDDEISLRKEIVNAIEDLETDSIIPNESLLTPQKQNYKIANALMLQNKPADALTYYDKSIEEASSRGDLEVQKDALRRKVDVYENLGQFDKAKSEFKKFMASVDQLYVKKQQEISQSARLTKNLIENQNRITSLENDRQLAGARYDLSVSRNQNQQIIIYSLIGGLILLLIGSYFTFKYIKQQRFANNLLALKSLRSQMNPHFIFNALNSVNGFIATNDERTANKYLADFSFLMRSILENSDEDFIPLKKEVDLIELYTKLEHFRFKDKFDYSFEIDTSIAIENYKIPPMLLQPYIENAIWHGLRYKTQKGHLAIKITQKFDNELLITIADDGIGRARSKALKTDNQKKHKSKGMTNIKKRIQILNQMYKDRVAVTINDFKDDEDSGTEVKVTLKNKQ